jgi:hypothetical protein
MTDRDAASARRFPPLWQVEQIDGGFKVLDASGQALVYVYARETREQAEAGEKGRGFAEGRRRGRACPLPLHGGGRHGGAGGGRGEPEGAGARRRHGAPRLAGLSYGVAS